MVRCPHHHTAIKSCLQCDQLRKRRQHLFQPPLDWWSRYSLCALYRFNELMINSASRGSVSYSIQLFQALGIPAHISVQNSYLPGVIATGTQDGRNFYLVLTAHHVFNITNRIVVTQGYEIVPRAPPWMRPFSHNGATPDSNPTVFCVRVKSRSHAVAASRVPYIARCNRQTVSGGSFASGSGSTHDTRTTSLHKGAFFHVDETELQRTTVSRHFLGHGFRNQKLDCIKRWSGCEEVRALLFCVVAFLHLLRHQPATNF